MDKDPQPNPFNSPANRPMYYKPPPDIEPPEEHPLVWFLKKFFACNPLYLVSAALLLYGLYLISSDTHIGWSEIARLHFNFGSLEFYELAVVATSIFLARRRIWYDSVLLVALENMLVFLPFLLINEAALMGPMQALDTKTVWTLCAIGGTAAILRFWSLKAWFAELNLPLRALGFGLLLLAVNIALPLLYRQFEETRLGARATDGAAYEMNRYTWLLLLPAMFALVNFLTQPRHAYAILPQHRWLPSGLFLVWIVATGVHAYSLGYVYDLEFQLIFAVPLAWVMTWTLWLRHTDFFSEPVPMLSPILLVATVPVTLLALATPNYPVFIALTGLNILFYVIAWLTHRERRTALHLALISSAALVAGFLAMHPFILPTARLIEFNSRFWLALATTLYLLFWIVRSRNPKSAVAGAVIVALAGYQLIEIANLYSQFPIQLALLFFLGQSLRWRDDEHFGAATVRILASIGWLMQTLFIIRDGPDFAVPVAYASGGLMLLLCVLSRLFARIPAARILAVAAVLMLVLQPADFLVRKTQAAPAGLIAVAGSFLLLALGTLLALTRSKWGHPPPPENS